MQVNFYIVTDDDRKINKTLGEPMSLNCNVRRDVDVYNPFFLVRDTVKLFDYNYIGWSGRYYFIRGISYIAQGMFRIETHIDVLMSYRETILASDCYIKQSGVVNEYFDGGDYNHLETIEKEVIKGNKEITQNYSTILVTIGNRGV